jgi:adenosylhomocysteinase
MDMSFANQSLCSEYIKSNGSKLEVMVHSVPKKIDDRIASLKLQTLGAKIDKLTPEQKKYLASWQVGT